MKMIIIGLVLFAGSFSACNNNSEEKENMNADTTVAITKTDTIPAAVVSISPMLASYLELKNALTNDDATLAAQAGKAVATNVDALNAAAMTEAQQKIFAAVKEDIKEHGEHISDNANKIAHQREHFEMLSRDIIDLVKVFESPAVLYVDHCPMANDGKGADWLSAEKTIKNPYYGKKMPTCGEVKEEIK